jgi:hypothetical protein
MSSSTEALVVALAVLALGLAPPRPVHAQGASGSPSQAAFQRGRALMLL